MAASALRAETLVFAPKCLSIDLEVGKKDARIHQFAAVRGDTGAAFVHKKGELTNALEKLDTFAEGSAFLQMVSFNAGD